MTTTAPLKPLPPIGFIAAGLILLLVIGSSFGGDVKFVVTVLFLIILVILLMEGYAQIDNVISSILAGKVPNA